ncbi:MAG TPA: glycosyltransferase family 39 protein [Anaerolineaceae bacterium]|jgi:hypothetical protein|nr:glycosyltransferase family 39 protein [Anaerolineaceae bacterium]HOH21502.1 glycosyltransferase family 39 protein [Anaerolineaceae bacterium]HOU45136.1 glycosyltransferase family 39 protein [Anaerolineaceae bacterium]HQF46741.1 glycosyltransferase family 39 protein [Anaerolineaceae bacterium]HQH36531.1 glycosyltransferase family 39 protein [Anaerolineaceae bacterium]
MRTKARQLTPYLIYGMMITILLTWKNGIYPSLWYDEGARLLMSRVLVTYGQYATYSVSGFNPFDPSVASGPLDILSLALFESLFGKSVSLLRLSIFPLTLIGAYLMLFGAIQLFGTRGGWMAVLTVLAAPPMLNAGYLIMGRQLLSENTSLTMVFLALSLWFHSWDKPKIFQGILAGIFLGLGLISKAQVAIWLLPALGLIWCLRTIQNRRRAIPEILFFISCGLIMVGWFLMGRIFSTPETLAYNQANIYETAMAQLFSGFSGKTFTRTSLFMDLTMLGISLLTWWDLLHHKGRPRLSNSREWGRASIATAVFICVLWHIFFDIGWPRHAYGGWILSLLLLGWWLWRLMEKMPLIQFNRYNIKPNHLYPLIVSGLIAISLINYLPPIIRAKGPVAVEQAAGWINENIPADAIVESTELELAGMSNHWEFHFPPNRIILNSMNDIFYKRIQPDHDYNILEWDPDYLITGQFSDWIGLYWHSSLFETEFIQVAVFPPYRIFERRR